MMASGFAATTAHRSASASNASTATPRVPSASMVAIFLADRVVPVTVWPASRRNFNNGSPITPVAPATKTFISPDPLCRRRMNLRGVVILEEGNSLAIRHHPNVDLGRRYHLAGLLEPPRAATQHDDTITLRDELIGDVFDHFPIAREAGEIIPERIPAAVIRHVLHLRRRALGASEPKSMLSPQIFSQSSTLPPLVAAQFL